MVDSERKKSPLSKRLLFLALILLALVGISSITSEWVQQGTKNRIGIVDITGLVGYYTIVGFTLNAFEVPPPEGVDALPIKN